MLFVALILCKICGLEIYRKVLCGDNLWKISLFLLRGFDEKYDFLDIEFYLKLIFLQPNFIGLDLRYINENY